MKKQLLDRAWADYKHAVKSGDTVSLRELGLPVGPRTQMGFASSPGDSVAAQDVVDRLIALWNKEQRTDADKEVDDERKIIELGTKFLKAVTYGRLSRAREILSAGFPVNYQDPRHKETALHISASKEQLNDFTNELLDAGKCELLLRDKFGRLALNNAIFFNPNSEDLIDRLSIETRAVADKEGIDLVKEQNKYQVGWFNQNWFIRLSHCAEFKPE